MTFDRTKHEKSDPKMAENAQIGIGETQELKRNFGMLSMLSLSVALMATWEALCRYFQRSTLFFADANTTKYNGSGLISGGPVSLLYGFILSFISSVSSAMSLGEMASMYPTAGGQYHFVSMLAPKRWNKILSWISGWVSTFGWQTVAASAPFLAGTMIQGLLVLNYENYVYERWHGTLLYWAILLVSLAANVLGSDILPLLEKLSLVFHVIGFIVVMVVICVVSPTKHSREFVFTEFINNSGWSNSGVAWSIGMLSSCYVMTGYDGAIHLSEEMQNPRLGVPISMVGSILINGSMGFGFLVAILYFMGDFQAALESNTGFPIIQIFYQITGNQRAATAMSCVIVVAATLATIPLVASAGRMLWALARDDAFPFMGFLAKVDEKRRIPSNAVYATTVFLALLGLINIGSTTAFTAIVSLAVFGLELSYLMPICLHFVRRLMSWEPISAGPWHLKRFGPAINLVAIIFLSYTSIFLVFPPYQPVTPANMNYASLVFGSVFIFSAVDWMLRGRKVYKGPIIEWLDDFQD